MDQGVMDSPVILVIKAPNQKYDDQTINCYQNWTVEKLKAHLSDVYPSKPVSIWLQSSQSCRDENMNGIYSCQSLFLCLSGPSYCSVIQVS